jgi:hypothetical protein
LLLIIIKLCRLQKGIYKKDNVLRSAKNPLSPKKQRFYLKSVLDKIAPLNRLRVLRLIRGKDKLFLYLAKPLTNYLGLVKY